MKNNVLNDANAHDYGALRFARVAWFVTFYNILVMIWGAFVRATGSGAGCGDHWPLCNGKVIPRAPEVATLIEFTHRLTSGLALLAVIFLVVMAFRSFAKGHLVRKLSIASLVFILLEALIGAAIVLARLVGEDESITRGVSMGVHLVNTFLLLGALTLTAVVANSPLHEKIFEKLFTSSLRRWRLAFFFGYFLLALVGVSGAIAALGDTLFPASSIRQPMGLGLEQTQHIFLELRIYHPVVSVAAALWWLGLVFWVFQSPILPKGIDGKKLLRSCVFLSGIIVVQLLLGIVNVWLKAPVWMQMLHLFVAYVVVCACVIFTAETLALLPISRQVQLNKWGSAGSKVQA